MRRVGSWRPSLGGNAGWNADLFRLASFLRSGVVTMCGSAKLPAPSALAPRLATLATAVGFREGFWVGVKTPL